METRLNNLSLRFQTKGFAPIEIRGLIKDVVCILDKSKYCSLAEVNRELEDLGWGLEIMDNVTYDIFIKNSPVQ